MSIYPAGAPVQTQLTGAEFVDIDNGGAIKVRATTAAIAALSGGGITQDQTNTGITTVGNGVLTAAALLGGIVTRTGPTGPYTDTTDTSAAIIAAIGTFSLNGTFPVIIKNITAFAQTLQGGVGVTMSAINVIGPYQEGYYFAMVGGTAAAPTVTLSHIQTGAVASALGLVFPSATALTTVGAGTITAAGIAGGYTNRTGPSGAFTDTTDTAAAIIAANPALTGKIGTTATYTYLNNSAFPATITGGMGVTVSGVTVVPPSGWVTYNVTYTAAATITLTPLNSNIDVPPAQFQTAVLTVGTFAAGAITGAAFTIYRNTGATPGAQTVRTAAQMLADFTGAFVGMSYMLRIINTGAGTLTLTADGGATVTLAGTATVTTNTFRDYVVTFNTATTATIQSAGSGTSP